jgi:hypothetical protein
MSQSQNIKISYWTLVYEWFTNNSGTSPFCLDAIVFFCLVLSAVSTMYQSMNTRHVGNQGHHDKQGNMRDPLSRISAYLCFQEL